MLKHKAWEGPEAAMNMIRIMKTERGQGSRVVFHFKITTSVGEHDIPIAVDGEGSLARAEQEAYQQLLTFLDEAKALVLSHTPSTLQVETPYTPSARTAPTSTLKL
jgi:hypothetical protein